MPVATGLIPEFICSDGVLKYEPEGYWHDGLAMTSGPGMDANSTTVVYSTRRDYQVGVTTLFYPCISSKSCTVDTADGSVTCAPGSTGVLCALCARGFYKSTFAAEYSYGCKPCTDTSIVGAMWPLAALFLFVIFCGVWWQCIGKAAYERLWKRVSVQVFHNRPLNLVVLFKIVLGFY